MKCLPVLSKALVGCSKRKDQRQATQECAEIELRGIKLMKPVKGAVVLAATALCAGLMVPVVAAVPAVAGTNGCPPDEFYGIAHQGAHDDDIPSGYS